MPAQIERLDTQMYAIPHALLASLPHSAAVTTNADLCYDLACASADVSLNILPYDTRISRSSSHRWILKLHGDVSHPVDIFQARHPLFHLLSCLQPQILAHITLPLTARFALSPKGLLPGCSIWRRPPGARGDSTGTPHH